MDQMQTPQPEKKQEEKNIMPKSCLGYNYRSIIKGLVLVFLGLVIAIPGLGRLISQYFYIILGALFVAWGLFVVFFKGKEK